VRSAAGAVRIGAEGSSPRGTLGASPGFSYQMTTRPFETLAVAGGQKVVEALRYQTA
jgi:hypothetical protein